MKGRPKNSDLRPREHLTPDEVDRLLKAAAKTGEHCHRDYTMILLAYRHGFRATELCRLQWVHVDFSKGLLHCGRLKGSNSNLQPLSQTELAALGRLHRDRLDGVHWVFYSERGPMTRNAFWRVVARAGKVAGLEFPIHPHMLRHACGYRLANAGLDTRLIQDLLGHRNIQHTVRYTATNPGRFIEAAKILGK